MTSTIIQNEKEDKWPRLMIGKGSIGEDVVILFREKESGFGTVVFNDVEPLSIGYFSSWTMSRLIPFTGTIQLKND